MRIAIVLTVVVGLWACGGDDEDPPQFFDICYETGSAYCDRFVSCGTATGDQRPACVDDWMEGCCRGQSICARTPDPPMSWDELAACEGAIDALTCDETATQYLPRECR